MATDPYYKKRMAKGAAQGALTGATAGTMAFGPVGGVVGGVGGGIAGLLLARPGETERERDARIAQLAKGVRAGEAGTITRRFMDPLLGATSEERVRALARQQGTATTGAAARQEGERMRSARRDLREASTEAQLAIQALDEGRRAQADRMRADKLRGQEIETRTDNRQLMGSALGFGGMIGRDLATTKALANQEAGLLPEGAVNAARGAAEGARGFGAMGARRANREDIRALEAIDGGALPVDFSVLPEGAPAAEAAAEPTVADLLEDSYEKSGHRFAFGDPVDPAPVTEGAGRTGGAPPVQTSTYTEEETQQALNAMGILPYAQEQRARIQIKELGLTDPEQIEAFYRNFPDYAGQANIINGLN